MNASSGMKGSAVVKDSNHLVQTFICMFTSTSAGDTLLLVANDDAGFKPGLPHVFSSRAKLTFY